LARRFRGENVHKMDKKGRVSVPASYRRVLAEGDADSSEESGLQFVLVYSDRGKNCLEGYTIDGMEAIEERVDELDEFSDEREYLENWLSGQSDYIPVETSGRCVLPERIRDKINLEAGEIVFLGLGSRFQIWAKADYEAHKAGLTEKFKGGDNPLKLLPGKKKRGGDDG